LRIRRVAGLLDEQVGGSGHIALDRRTLLDAYAYAMERWLDRLEGGLNAYPNLARVMDNLSQDSGVQSALAKEAA